MNEAELRDTATNETAENLLDLTTKLSQLNTTNPWLNASQIEDIQKKVDSFKEWFADNVQM